MLGLARLPWPSNPAARCHSAATATVDNFLYGRQCLDDRGGDTDTGPAGLGLASAKRNCNNLTVAYPGALDSEIAMPVGKQGHDSDPDTVIGLLWRPKA